MKNAGHDDEILQQLRKRVGKIHLRQRLGIEQAWESRVFGQGRTFFHIENWYSLRAMIRGSLRLSLLYGRSRRNARRIEVRHNSLVIPGLPRAFDGYTLLHITDLHIDFADDFPHVLIEAVRPLEYDLCVLTGDYRGETYGPFEGALSAMQQLRTWLQGDVYAVLGNHDTIRMVPGMEAMGIRMLLNEHEVIRRGTDCIYLAGIDDPHYFRADNLEKAADSIPDGAVSILLSHSPEIYKHAAHADFNVLLCGHTHAGQICLPGGIPVVRNASCPRKYCAGAWTFNDMAGYTAAGSGACVVDVRINCPPEVTLHRLQCA
jgi:predicted MPP superfamily phosphohydrolase